MRVDDDRRAEYARILADALDRDGESLRSIARRLGVSVETLRLNRHGRTVPATRARTRAQDKVLRTGGALESVLYGASSSAAETGVSRMMDELVELRRRVRDLEAELPAPSAGPGDQRSRPAVPRSPRIHRRS